MIHQQDTELLFLPTELAFFAEDELIDIVPNFQLRDLVNDHMLVIDAGTFGPFRPNSVTQVPVWMALMLHRRRKCRINPPAWLTPAHLEEVLAADRRTGDVFEELPFHYLEIAHLLFTHAKDSFGAELQQVRDLLDELARVRHNKVQAGLRELAGAMSVVKLNNLACMEVNKIRPFFQAALDRFFRLRPLDPDRQDAADLGAPDPRQ